MCIIFDKQEEYLLKNCSDLIIHWKVNIEQSDVLVALVAKVLVDSILVNTLHIIDAYVYRDVYCIHLTIWWATRKLKKSILSVGEIISIIYRFLSERLQYLHC